MNHHLPIQWIYSVFLSVRHSAFLVTILQCLRSRQKAKAANVVSRCLQSSPLLSFSVPVDTVSSLPISGRGEKGQLSMARHFERELVFTVFILAYCYDGSILLRWLQFSNLSTKPHHKYVVREKPRLGESVLCSYCPSCVRWTLQTGADSISMTQCESAQDTIFPFLFRKNFKNWNQRPTLCI